MKQTIPCVICGVNVKRSPAYKISMTYCAPCYEDTHTDYIEDFITTKYKYSEDEDKEIEAAYTNHFGLYD